MIWLIAKSGYYDDPLEILGYTQNDKVREAWSTEPGIEISEIEEQIEPPEKTITMYEVRLIGRRVTETKAEVVGPGLVPYFKMIRLGIHPTGSSRISFQDARKHLNKWLETLKSDVRVVE